MDRTFCVSLVVFLIVLILWTAVLLTGFSFLQILEVMRDASPLTTQLTWFAMVLLAIGLQNIFVLCKYWIPVHQSWIIFALLMEVLVLLFLCRRKFHPVKHFYAAAVAA